jgi:hypothetical protein
MSVMPSDYSISVRWAKGDDVQLGTYELSGDLPKLLEQAYEKSIEEGKSIFEPDRVDISAVPKPSSQSSL